MPLDHLDSASTDLDHPDLEGSSQDRPSRDRKKAQIELASPDPGQDDATMAEPDDSSTKDKPGWINGEDTDLKPADETEDELEPAEESMLELKPAEVIVDELDELTLDVSDVVAEAPGPGSGGDSFFPLSKKHVIIHNVVKNRQTLNVHCKSDDDDLGLIHIPWNHYWGFRFRVNIWSTTMFRCHFT
ncbi:hypothetical protein F2Q70_00001227 [Brassica cretica]|uniref:S-protein homolog n=1 Tax=Brassica cretica TaxID=69181 RepID=A0A8S9IXU1_BRACR|nr:hypothetical protein F2Q70_00001227 [Brassica cretica]